MERATRQRRQLTLGVIGLALLAGLAFVLRDVGGLGGDGAGERFVVDFAAARDLTQQDRTVLVTPGLSADVRVQPRPFRPMTTMAFRVTLREGDRPAPAEDVELAFNMEMDMGRHVYRLLPDGESWRAEVVLPSCSWGGERWYARLRFESGGQRHETVLLFDLPRGGRPAPEPGR